MIRLIHKLLDPLQPGKLLLDLDGDRRLNIFGGDALVDRRDDDEGYRDVGRGFARQRKVAPGPKDNDDGDQDADRGAVPDGCIREKHGGPLLLLDNGHRLAGADIAMAGDDQALAALQAPQYLDGTALDEPQLDVAALRMILNYNVDSLPVLQRDHCPQGNHDDVLEDAVLAWRLVKPGGLIIFDDYGKDRIKRNKQLKKPTKDYYCSPAINAFAQCFDTKFEVIHNGYQLILQRVRVN